jgi:hypothetical protein
MMSYVDPKLKANARSFLEALDRSLNAKLPPADQLGPIIRQTATHSKTDANKKHLGLRERVFLYEYVIRHVFDQMQSVDGIGEADARAAFLCEGYRNVPQYCSGHPARTEPHPFTKIIGSSTPEVFSKWAEGKGKSFTRPNPDFAFREPFPFKIVFECKYFEQGTAEKAARDLVSDIYQAFFYRSLPYVAPKGKGAPWDYDFACLLAYDASPRATLLAAWSKLTEAVQLGFWRGANVYVMILRPVG